MFDSVVEVTTYRDAGLEQIKHLPDLQALDFFCGVGITDKGLAELREVPRLRRLRFKVSGKATEAGLANLRFLTHLRRLDMEDSRMADASVRYVRG